MSEPNLASDYDDRGAQAAHAVLIELGQVLGAHRDAIVVIGGSVPSLLLPKAEPSHIGSLDIDLDLDPEKLSEHGYAELIEKFAAAGYERNVEGLKPFQLRRTVDLKDGGEPIAVIVDLLMPKGAKTKKNRPQLVEGLRVQEVDGGSIALRHSLKLMIAGTMPDGRKNEVEMLVASIPALLVMKGFALVQRDKKKDAYDIYYSSGNSPADRKRSRLSAPLCLRTRLHAKAIRISPASSTERMASDRKPFDSSSRVQMRLET